MILWKGIISKSYGVYIVTFRVFLRYLVMPADVVLVQRESETIYYTLPIPLEHMQHSDVVL